MPTGFHFVVVEIDVKLVVEIDVQLVVLILTQFKSFPSWIFGGHVAFSEYDAFFSSDSSGSDEDDWWGKSYPVLKHADMLFVAFTFDR